MKKILAIIMSVLMLGSMLSMLALPAMADGATDNEGADTSVKETYKMYVSDEGNDANDGLSADKPKKTINAIINHMKEKLPNKEHDVGEIILVGDVTASVTAGGKTYFEVHDGTNSGEFPIVITSSDKNEHIFKIDRSIRLGGDTTFTNLKLLTTVATQSADIAGCARPSIYAAGNKLVIGAEGVKDDVITYSLTDGSKEALTIVGTTTNAVIGANAMLSSVDMVINSGEYRAIAIGGYDYGGWVTGDINVVINDAKMNGGAISLGGMYQIDNAFAGIFLCEGDVKVAINGGTFNGTKICVGYATNKINKDRKCFPNSDYELKLSEGDYAQNIFCGDVVIDINGGSFTGANIIGKGSTLDAKYADMADNLKFEEIINVDLSTIADSDRAPYKAIICASDLGEDAGAIVIGEHIYNRYEISLDDDSKHEVWCDCGCETFELEEHIWDNGTVETYPTHSSEGVMKYTCTKGCGATKTEAIEAGHCMNGDWKGDETNHWHECTDSACPDADKGAIKEAHTFGEATVTTEATHMQEGKKTSVCSICNYQKIEIIEKISSHTFAGDFVEHNDTHHKKVCECGEEKLYEHAWDEGKVTAQPTADAEGVKTYTCSGCGATKTEAVPMLEEGGGCTSTVGTAIASMAILGTGFAFAFKKKED